MLGPHRSRRRCRDLQAISKGGTRQNDLGRRHGGGQLGLDQVPVLPVIQHELLAFRPPPPHTHQHHARPQWTPRVREQPPTPKMIVILQGIVTCTAAERHWAANFGLLASSQFRFSLPGTLLLPLQGGESAWQAGELPAMVRRIPVRAGGWQLPSTCERI